MTRILVADYSGHPFQVQLSRALASRGYQVLHLFSASSETPKGELQVGANDPAGLDIRSVRLEEPFDKYNFVKRRSQEIEIGRRFAREIRTFSPDIALFANQPIDTLAQTVPALKACGSKFVFWLQDLLGEAASSVLANKFGPLGRLVGAYYRRRELRFLAAADHVVAISDDFTATLARSIGLDRSGLTVIENWAPLDSMPQFPRDNEWARDHLPNHPFRLIYSGTLGMKQNPAVLTDLAEKIDSSVLIFSEGVAARRIADEAAGRSLSNVSVRDWLPFGDLPKALAGADVLTVILEPDAGVFSVPSKVLTYMCVGRPILAAIPGGNLAARLIHENGCGIVVEPGDSRAFTEAARRLADAPTLRETMGKAARAYAERAFDIGRITDRFETVFEGLKAKGAMNG